MQTVLLSLPDYKLGENSDLELSFISEYPALRAKPGVDEVFYNYFLKEMKGGKDGGREGGMEGEEEETCHHVSSNWFSPSDNHSTTVRNSTPIFPCGSVPPPKEKENNQVWPTRRSLPGTGVSR